MDKSEALRSIQYDLVEYIQKRVKVNFDNDREMPVYFVFGGKTYQVDEMLGRFKMVDDCPVNGYLVAAEGEVYLLYFHYYGYNPRMALHRGTWVLSFRILGDNELMAFYREERKMLVNMTLKHVVDFHGHLCPDLAIGIKVCEYIRKILSSINALDKGFSIVAENCTSAVDAIQVLLGATLGNQRLYIMDFGKHNYRLLPAGTRIGYRFSLKRQNYGDQDKFNRLEQKMMADEMVLEDLLNFQTLLDRRVNYLLNMRPEELFVVRPIEADQYLIETASVYFVCSRCGEQVIKSKKIDFQGKTYCIPCFQQMNKGCMYYRLQ